MPPRSLHRLKPAVWTARLAKGCPPGLLPILQVLKTYPKEAQNILEREIEHRREFILLADEARTFVWWRLTDALQGFAVMSIVIVSLLWTFKGVAQIRDWLRTIDPRQLPGAENFSQWEAVIKNSPMATWPWQWLALLVAILVIGLFARHVGVMLFSIRDLRPLRAASRLREQEIAILQTWMKFIKDQT